MHHIPAHRYKTSCGFDQIGEECTLLASNTVLVVKVLGAPLKFVEIFGPQRVSHRLSSIESFGSLESYLLGFGLL